MEEQLSILEHSIKRIDNDLAELKKNDKAQDEKLHHLEKMDDNHSMQINNILTILGETKENTQWIRRTLTKAFITAAVGGVFSLVVGILIWYITK